MYMYIRICMYWLNRLTCKCVIACTHIHIFALLVNTYMLLTDPKPSLTDAYDSFHAFVESFGCTIWSTVILRCCAWN